MIPFVDLRGQYAGIRDEITAATAGVLESGQFVLGDEVAAFEEEFAAYCGVPFGVAVNSGTSALHLALLAAGVGPGDEVITVPFTFAATVAAIGYAGARAVLVDVDPVTLTIDPEAAARVVTPRTKAIIAVHIYGQPADMDPLRALCERHGLTLIEDAAQAHGAERGGRRVGGLGHLACFSFYPSKNLGAYGEGGFVATADPGLAEAVRALRDWGMDAARSHRRRGFNYRMDGLQGAILRVKLRHLEGWTEARRARAAEYDTLLAGAAARPVGASADARHVYHLYAVLSDDRDALRAALAAEGVQTGVHYPCPVHLEPAYADLGYREGDFPVSESASRRTLSLPMYPEIAPADVARVAELVGAHAEVAF